MTIKRHMENGVRSVTEEMIEPGKTLSGKEKPEPRRTVAGWEVSDFKPETYRCPLTNQRYDVVIVYFTDETSETFNLLRNG